MVIVYSLLFVLSLATVVAWCVVRVVGTLHMLQLDSYNNQRLMKWLRALPSSRLFDLKLALILLGLATVTLLLWLFGVPYGPWILLAVWCIVGGVLFLRRNPPEAKKPLIYTGRAKRILSVALFVCVVIVALFAAYIIRMQVLAANFRTYWLATFLTFMVGLVITQVAWLAVILANVLLKPVQSRINASFVQSARDRLRQINPIVIGVAGSYGKTSTKFILETLLAGRFRVLKTPGSYNNLLGISRVINGELKPEHEVFIVELGGYKRGDIKKSTNLVHPTISIIAAIGPEHLERLKTMENVDAMNYEAIEALPASGVAVFNNDMERCRALADGTTHVKVVRYGLDRSQPDLFLTAEDIVLSAEGLSFTIIDREGNRISTKTSLLGKHNVLNILGAAAVAMQAGLSLAEVAARIPKIKQVEHRLQLIRGQGGITVIDDAYNSNPLGADEALNVLKEFNGGKRILITPGMVELGHLEETANKEFGSKAARICDYVLLVGAKQTEAILKGLASEKFPKEKIRIVGNLAEATQELQRIVKPGDVVLFENDLPDLYSEA